ncbi:acyltransferase family protein [Cellulomonas sp. ATA003]|uniref:acyltransferase family protein n=1 Tax=Cellulomonas sp. ATA003 TaxID=3073064 RepID=UPI0028735B3F|nr:acyltransferase family protein [Cellulomonas sp. ATA003]WNB85058.1 acyltransferase family protein [Cellulomonas sp. ATA003]
MDLLRGGAILLVLLWHAPAIPALYGYTVPDWVLAANDALLPFRMPALMFLSGLLLPRSLAKPLRDYLTGKVSLLVWPYLLFAGLHMALYGPTGPVWHPYTWIATGYLWFLFNIACYYFAAPMLRWLPAWVVPILAFAAAVPTDGRTQRFFYFAGFFFAGALVARHHGVLEAALRRRWLVVICGVAAVVLGAVSAVRDVEHQAAWAPLSLAGIVVAIAAAQRLQDAAWTRPVQSVGRASIVYYTSHFPVMIVSLAVCEAVGIDDIGAFAWIGLAAAVAIGALLAHHRTRRPVVWLYEAPFLPRRRTPGPVRVHAPAAAS